MAVPLVQLTRRSETAGAPAPAASTAAPVVLPWVRKPSWLKVQAPGGPSYLQVQRMMRDLGLHTVCEEAHCPNIGECWEHRAATFMILGDVCTRNCAYCAVSHGTPQPYDAAEPARLAEAVERMGLEHVVITSVDRDDLPNGGAEAFAGCVTEIRKRRLPRDLVEVLIPDFKGSDRALQIVMDARPDILNHNLETAERLYRMARPGGRYPRALRLLRRARAMAPDGADQVRNHRRPGRGVGRTASLPARPAPQRREHPDARAVPAALSDSHLPVARYYTSRTNSPSCDRSAWRWASPHVQASPLTRSSYHAWEQIDHADGAPGEPNHRKGSVMAVSTDRHHAPERRGPDAPYSTISRLAATMLLIRHFEEQRRRSLLAGPDRRLLSPVHRAGSGGGGRLSRPSAPTTMWSARTASTARRWPAG